MTFADYQVKAFFNEKRKIDAHKMNSEALRHIAVYLLSPYLDKKDRHKLLSDIIPLPWEADNKRTIKLTKRQIEKNKKELEETLAVHRKFFEMRKLKKDAESSRINSSR